MLKQPRPIAVTAPRYIVQAIDWDDLTKGFQIVDRQGQDEPYSIELPEIDPYGPPERTPEQLQDSIDHTWAVCDHWAYTWNIVELGYCGSCQKLRSEVADGKTYPAVGFHHLDKKICFYCACSQED